MMDITELRAAIEQVEYVQGEIASGKAVAGCLLDRTAKSMVARHVPAIRAVLDENEALRAKLEIAKAAPHAESCWKRTTCTNGDRDCDCWKAGL